GNRSNLVCACREQANKSTATAEERLWTIRLESMKNLARSHRKYVLAPDIRRRAKNDSHRTRDSVQRLGRRREVMRIGSPSNPAAAAGPCIINIVRGMAGP